MPRHLKFTAQSENAHESERDMQRFIMRLMAVNLAFEAARHGASAEDPAIQASEMLSAAFREKDQR